MRVFKNLFGKGDKIHVDEIVSKVSGVAKLLSFCIIKEHRLDADGSFIRFGNGFTIAWKLNVPLKYDQGDRLIGNWNTPFPVGANSSSYMVIPIITNNHMDVKYRGILAGSVTSNNNVIVRLWSMANQSFATNDTITCNVLVLGF